MFETELKDLVKSEKTKSRIEVTSLKSKLYDMEIELKHLIKER